MIKELEILYEDEDILAINKPVGLIVHPDGKTKEPSVSEWFVKKYPESKNVGEPIARKDLVDIERPGVVHRIDRETSGALLLAKTERGHKALKRQFQNKEMEKIYYAFVSGIIKDDRGTINLPIARSVRDFRKRSVGKKVRGAARDALTYFQVLKRLPKEKMTFVEARPKTGRTHQIRVHFKAIHHPILGDKLYGSKKESAKFSRLALHARSLRFKDVSGKEHKVTADYPEDFREALDKASLVDTRCPQD